jgi:hypothetical protein
MPKIDNIFIYGINQSFKASKYPKATDTSEVNSEITDTIKNLAKCETGTGHDNFLNGIVVQFDLTFSNKAWVELQRYHFIDFVSSQSSMHKIAVMDIRKMCNEYVDERIISVLQDLKDKYNETKSKEDYLTLLYNIPSGFELTARMTTNYRQLKTIYQQRRHHRLVDWQVFCDWIETLPYSELITGKEV